MDLSPYLEGLRRDLGAVAEPGGPEVKQTAELLTNALEPSVRLCLLEALSDATAEITTKLGEGLSVEVRLRGRQADFTVTEVASTPETPPPPPVDTDSGDVARITLRLPEPLKEAVERSASAERISANAWLVRAIANAVHGAPPPGRGASRLGRRVTGYAQA